MQHSSAQSHVEPLFASIDFGSQSIRSYLYDLQGNMVYRSHIDMDITGSSTYQWQSDPAQLAEVVASMTDDLLSQTIEGALQKHQISAVSLTCLRNSFVYLDKNNKPLLPVLYWYQGRRAEQLPKLPWYWRAAFAVVGQTSTIKKLQRQAAVNWVAEHHPQAQSNTKHLCQLSGYLQASLTGNYRDSWANMIAHLPFNFKHRRWLWPLAWQWSALNLKPNWLPELCDPGTELGLYSTQIHGKEADVSVIAGAADKTCELLGAGVIDADTLFVSLGTAITINCLVSKFKGPKRFYPAYPSFSKNYYLAEEMLDFGCRVLREFVAWKREHMIDDVEVNEDTLSEAHLEEWICHHLLDAESGIQLSAQISDICSQLTIVETFDLSACCVADIFNWQQDEPSVNHRDPESMEQIAKEYLLLLHWLAIQIQDAKGRIERRHNREFKRILVSGGGQQSNLLLKLIADMCQLPVQKANQVHTGGRGAAIITAVAKGHYTDFESAVSAMCTAGKVIEPNTL
ncbi:xylulokinase [Thalassotalea sp. PS06]|uniref:xylulokinase n=1 Tax=Thalassotalea sp. PS06 TaxID=2594005 RepID=UPI001165343D|nr:FGGY family carbohydrate kinase [Thalassotalea sp. PS06]QDP01425.1 hypothetical protein FNC98_08840 [Thalassotalea sp. PS06]